MVVHDLCLAGWKQGLFGFISHATSVVHTQHNSTVNKNTQGLGKFGKWKEWVVSQIVRGPKWVWNHTINTDTVSVPLTMAGSLFRREEVIEEKTLPPMFQMWGVTRPICFWRNKYKLLQTSKRRRKLTQSYYFTSAFHFCFCLLLFYFIPVHQSITYIYLHLLVKFQMEILLTKPLMTF